MGSNRRRRPFQGRPDRNVHVISGPPWRFRADKNVQGLPIAGAKRGRAIYEFRNVVAMGHRSARRFHPVREGPHKQIIVSSPLKIVLISRGKLNLKLHNCIGRRQLSLLRFRGNGAPETFGTMQTQAAHFRLTDPGSENQVLFWEAGTKIRYECDQ